MGIGKRKSDRLPELKWDCVIGKYVLEERVLNSSGEWENQQTNIDNNKFRGVADLPNLEVGWVGYIKGLGRDTVLVPVGKGYGERPSDKYREGLRLLVKLDGSLGGIVCEFVSTLSSVWQEIDKLHDDYTADAAKHETCLPAIDVVDVRKEQGRDAPILIPIYKIAGWVPRPPDLPKAGIPIFKPTKKKAADEATSDNGNSNGNGHERPKVNDALNDEIPF